MSNETKRLTNLEDFPEYLSFLMIKGADEEEVLAAINKIQDYLDEPKQLKTMVDHPEHYMSKNGLEAIDVMESFMTEDAFQGFLEGNAIKYMLRWRNKNGIEDLEKAMWYMDRLVQEIEKCEEQFRHTNKYLKDIEDVKECGNKLDPDIMNKLYDKWYNELKEDEKAKKCKHD